MATPLLRERFFVSVTDEIHPLVAQVYYQQGSDQVEQVICRTPVDTRAIYLDMDIVTKVAVGKKEPTMQPLLQWYLRCNPARHTKEHVNMWTNPAALLGCQARRNLQCSLLTPSGEPWRACDSYCGT